jgi:hypothetical protein
MVKIIISAVDATVLRHYTCIPHLALLIGIKKALSEGKISISINPQI